MENDALQWLGRLPFLAKLILHLFLIYLCLVSLISTIMNSNGARINALLMLIMLGEFERVHHQSAGFTRLCHVNWASSGFNLIRPSPPVCLSCPQTSRITLWVTAQHYSGSCSDKFFQSLATSAAWLRFFN